MIYHRKNKKRFSGYKIVLGVFFIFLFFRILNISFFTQIFDRPINSILESHTVVLAPIKNSLIYFKSKKDLEEKNKTLQKENADLKIEKILQTTATREFEHFLTTFGTTTSGTSYKVILKPPFIPFDNIRIAGDFSTKNIGDLVFYKTILIGKITEKDSYYATVELFSTPDKITPVTIQGTQFEARGLGGGRFVLEASKEFEVTVGDPIIYPEKNIFILGVVEFVESKEENLFKKIYFNTPIPISEISYVTMEI